MGYQQKKISIKLAITVLSFTFLVGCSSITSIIKSTSCSANQTSSSKTTNLTKNNKNSVVYKNTQYGFNFTLPKSWQSFSITTGIWEGHNVALGKVTETGPIISIRHPQWNSVNPRQDIPIMVLTLNQWNLLQKEKISIGAAPIGPSELGRNNMYVFAIPARYNFTLLTGYKEVEKILNNHPLQSYNLVQSKDPNKDILLNMMQLAKQGKIINCNFAAKTTNMSTITENWGKADKTVYVASAKGTYSTYGYHNAVFGFNKGEQVFEVRSFDTRLKNLSITKVKEVFGTPAYDTKNKNEEIIGYKAGTEFKIEMVFTLPTSSNPNPGIDHYNVLYPNGTVNSMAGDSGRQW